MDSISIGKVIIGRIYRISRDVGLSMICMVLSIIKLCTYWNKILYAQKILVLENRGFGRTISDPDKLRRVYRGEKVVTIIFERAYHNRYSEHIWPDCTVIILPFCFITKRGRVIWSLSNIRKQWVVLLAEGLRYLCRIFSNAEIIRIEALIVRVRGEYGLNRHLGPRASKLEGIGGYDYFKGWTHIINSIDVPRLDLPEKYKSVIYKKVEKYVHGYNSALQKICVFYCRWKSFDRPQAYSNYRRNGGEFDSRKLAIRYLIEKGYLVFIVGDFELGLHIDNEFVSSNRHVVCAELIDEDERWFSLFATLNCNMWIGDMGGGYILPCVNKIPMLFVNAFPFGHGTPNAWCYYKIARYANGNLVPHNILFTEFASDFELSDSISIYDNTSEEMFSAVKQFEEYVSGKRDIKAVEERIQLLPDTVLAKHVNGKILPCWFDNYEREK